MAQLGEHQLNLYMETGVTIIKGSRFICTMLRNDIPYVYFEVPENVYDYESRIIVHVVNNYTQYKWIDLNYIGSLEKDQLIHHFYERESCT